MHGKIQPNRVLVIAPTPFFADRGCHVRILGEIKALKKQGDDVLLCTYHLGRNIDNISTIRTLSIPWYQKLSAGPSIHKFYIDVLLLWKVLQACKSFRPTLLHAHLHEGIVIGKLASWWHNIPMVADLQGSLTEEVLDHGFIPRWRWLSNIVRWIEKKVNEMPLHLIASATRIAQQVAETFGATNVSTIGDGVDLDIFCPQPEDIELKTSLGIDQEDQVVVFIGVLTAYQGIDLLLDAADLVLKDVPTAKFLIIGFPEKAYREKSVAMGLEAHVIFTGKIEYADAPRYLSLGQVAVSPKISSSEANLKLFTYMAMGLPSVVFDNPVNREILGDLGVYCSNGELVPFANSIVELLQNPERARQLGEDCFQKAASEYSWDAVGYRLQEVYKKHAS